MRIWIDLANSPHVPFFRPLIREFERRGHQVELTARAFAQTVELARAAGLSPTVIGMHGGRRISGKLTKLIQRATGLARWARKRQFDLTVSHNSHEHIVAAWILRIPTVTLMDYEHHPANHLSFRLASRVIVPAAFPEASLRKFGVGPEKVRRYGGIKEDVYLSDFGPDRAFSNKLSALGIGPSDVLVVARAPADFALYHRMETHLFDQLIESLTVRENVKVILLARTEGQRHTLLNRHTASNIIFPGEALDGANLIASADLVVSAGGTMNREAAVLGVPAFTTFAGKWAAVDEQLVSESALTRINSRDDFEKIKVQKKQQRNPRRALGASEEVANLILESW